MASLRTVSTLVTIAVMLVLPSVSTAGAFQPPPRPAVSLEGHVNCPYMPGQGGTAYLQLTVATADPVSPARRPVNLAIVLDRSGSMRSEGKMENAKAALRALIDQLHSDDILSIVVYDDVVDVLRRACRVGNRDDIRRLVDEVYPRGWTNLGGGMIEGFHQAEKNVGGEFVNRVILLSDGLANQGITDPAELTRIVRRFRARSISLTTIGVGLEYNENLMVSLSEGGGGNYYFLESARNLASVFRKEFNLLSCLVAQNASIELTFGKGVRVRDVIGCENEGERDRHTIRIGDLYGGECREFTVELDVPPGRGYFTVATGVVRYAAERGGSLCSKPMSVAVRYTSELAEVERNRDWTTQARAEVAASTRKVEEALQSFDQGRKDEALKTLQAAQAAIVNSPAAAQGGQAGAVLRDQEAKLKEYSSALQHAEGDGSRAKKSVQYENYKVQKNK
jgi:Ca-activated chloride channel family protein